MSKPSIFGKRVIWASGTPNIYCPTDALDSWTRMETGAFAPSTSADYIPPMLTTSLWAVFGKHLNICDPSGHMVKILFLKWLKNYFFGYCRIKIPWSHLCPGQNGEDEHGHMKELNLVGMKSGEATSRFPNAKPVRTSAELPRCPVPAHLTQEGEVP